jgi:hypothetical protein
MAKEAKPLTGESSIATWLKHPVGGPMLRELLEQGGQYPDALHPVRILPFKRLVAMSKGAFTPEMVEELVRRAAAEE